MLLKVVVSGKLQPLKLVTHRFAMNYILKAYDTFRNPAAEGTLRVIVTNGDAKRWGHCHQFQPYHGSQRLM